MIGGAVCKEDVGANFLVATSQELSTDVLSVLWLLFEAIGKTWMNSSDSSSYKPQWNEFINLRITSSPNYEGEYLNAYSVINELVDIYGQEEAFTKLLLNIEHTDGDTGNRLAHTKKYVVNEFIKVYLTSGGFKEFGSRNYNSFIGGLRNSNPAPYRSIGE